MASWEPVDIDPIDHDKMAEDDDKWDDDLLNDLEKRSEELRQFDKTLNESRDESVRDESIVFIDALKNETIELVANQRHDKLTNSFNNTRKRLGILKGIVIAEPIRNYDNFNLAEDGEISYIYKRTVIDLGNINERLKAPWKILKLLVTKLRSMGFTNITDEDIQPHRTRYVKARKKLRKLDENLDERSKAIESSSTTDADAIELMEMTSKEIHTTVNDVEQGTSFIEPGERDKLLPLR